MVNAETVQNVYLRLLNGWNERDAEAMASCFALGGTMIGFDGSVVEGRAAIAAHLSPIFADHPTPAFVAIVRSEQAFGDAGLLRADVGMVPPGGTQIKPEVNARQVVVARLEEGRWLIELFQNTPAALHWDAAERERLTLELNDALQRRGHLPIGVER